MSMLSSPGSHPYLASPRTRFLLGFWAELCAFDQLPQLDRWLVQRFRADRRLGKKDRSWYSDAFFAAMRGGLWAMAMESLWIRGHQQPFEEVREAGAALWHRLRSVPGERLFLWLSIRDFPDHPWVKERAEADFPRQLPTDLGMEGGKLLEASIPLWLAPALKRRQEQSAWTDPDQSQFLNYQSRRARLWLRAEEAHINRIGASLSPTILRHPGALGLPADSPIPEGLLSYELQDWASQAIGQALPLKGNEWVWDACAGGGGKTLQLAARLRGAERILATDIRTHKLKDLQARAENAGFPRLRTARWDGEGDPPIPAEVLRQGGFDAVLVDAPCSSTGTWRRSPDAKFRIDPKSLLELTDLQTKLLAAAACKVRPGGFLCYATCSWLVEENEELVAAFLENNREFTLYSQKLCGAPEEDADTMFWALLIRQEKTL